MFYHSFVLFILFFFSLLSPLSHTWGANLPYEQQIVKKIEIALHPCNGSPDEIAAVLARLKTQSGIFFSQVTFDEDLKQLAQEYDRVEPVVESTGEEMELIIHLWPRPIIRSIVWHGNQQIKTARLQKELSIACFSSFDRKDFNTAFHQLKTYYTKKGFFEAELSYTTEVDEEKNEVIIRIDIHEGRAGKIERIYFLNFTEEEEKEALKLMQTKEYSLLMSWYTEEGTYHQEAVQQDQLLLTQYLQNRGYADAQVQIDVAESERTHRIVLNITAEKGELYTYGPLSFEGNHLFSDEEIQSFLTIQTGEPFSLEAVRDTIERIKEAYGRKGYIDTLIDFEPELIEGTLCYRLHFKIEEGSQFHVGLIRVFGNTCTDSAVILHETVLVPGEVFNTIKLKATEERLRNIGYFKNVNVYAVKGTESPLEGNYRDVYIEVEETETGYFNIFLGYSSVEEIFGGINITERNFSYRGLGRVFRDGLRVLRGGGEYLQLTAQVGQKSNSVTLSWTKPHFRDSRWTIGGDLSKSVTRYVAKAYDLDTTCLILRAHRDVNAFLRWGFQYRLKNGEVDLKHKAKHINLLEEEARIHGLISGLGMSLTYDSTNHPIRPSRGFRSKLFVEYAGLGGDHRFLSAAYLNSYYASIGSRAVLKCRLDYRFILPMWGTSYHTLPLDERIFLGGDVMLRGYRPYRIGPHYPGNDEVPRGGISLGFYSLELMRRIITNCEVFGFIDAGQLSEKMGHLSYLYVSMGYGMRLKVIDSIPPMTFGMGYPVNAKHRSEVKKFFFSFGGNF